MDDYIDPSVFGFDERFAIGQPVPRSEDPVLLRGEGHYSDDVSLPGQAYAVMLRSTHAHGAIRGIDTRDARAMPGVLAIYTAADLAKGGIGPLPARQLMNNRDGTPMLCPVRHALATDKVRHVGEGLAAVVAETIAAAKDAAEAIIVDIDPLPAVSEPALADAQEPCVIVRGPFPDLDERLRELPQPGENCLVEHSLPGRRDGPHAADDLPDGLQAADLR